MPSLARLSPADVERAHAVLFECGRDLSARFGLAHWDPPYPIEKLRADAGQREVYAVLDGNETAGTFTIGDAPLADYPPGSWLVDGAPALYLNRLAILPRCQRRGMGEWCVARVAELALRRGARSIRCDAIAAHAPLLAFYRRLGFDARGRFLNQGFDVVCLEKSLPPA